MPLAHVSCCFLRVLGVTRASRQAKEDARAQALRGKWRKPKSCHDMFKGKQSLFSPACVPKKQSAPWKRPQRR